MRGFKRRILWSLTLTVALGTVGGAQAQLRYRVEAVGVLGPDNADSFSGAYGVNNHGTVAGFVGSMSNSIPQQAIVYENGQARSLGTLKGLVTAEAQDINDRGRMRDLNDLLDPDAAQHWKLYDAMDINDRGQIVGMGMVDGLTRGFIATPVPEAGTWALMLAGLGGVGAVAWRRRSDVPARHLTAPYQ